MHYLEIEIYPIKHFTVILKKKNVFCQGLAHSFRVQTLICVKLSYLYLDKFSCKFHLEELFWQVLSPKYRYYILHDYILSPPYE